MGYFELIILLSNLGYSIHIGNYKTDYRWQVIFRKSGDNNNTLEISKNLTKDKELKYCLILTNNNEIIINKTDIDTSEYLKYLYRIFGIIDQKNREENKIE